MSAVPMVQDDVVSTPGPREGGPRRRRTFTPTEKLDHLVAYEAACETGEGGAYLRGHGVYSAQISEWRKLRDAGMLQGKKPSAKIGRPSAEQAEVAQLEAGAGTDPQQTDENRSSTGDHGKSSRALGGDLRERGHRRQATRTLTSGYDELIGAGTSTRDAALLTGLARATQHRRTQHRPRPGLTSSAALSGPVNKLTDAEAQRVLAVLNSARFIDKPPQQVYAILLAEGTYLCSVSTMYRILGKNRQVADRRRQATHPPRAVPELQATGPRQVYSRRSVTCQPRSPGH